MIIPLFQLHGINLLLFGQHWKRFDCDFVSHDIPALHYCDSSGHDPLGKIPLLYGATVENFMYGDYFFNNLNSLQNLFFSTAFCNCWRHIMRMELQHKTVNFNTVFEGPTSENDFRFGFIMLIVDIFLYMIIGHIYERFKQSDLNFYDVPNKESTDPQIGALMQNVSKYYNTDKLAVSDMSIVFRRDHITCLLGRNGAGKSTVMYAMIFVVRCL